MDLDLAEEAAPALVPSHGGLQRRSMNTDDKERTSAEKEGPLIGPVVLVAEGMHKCQKCCVIFAVVGVLRDILCK